jgi:hypothetical protein
MHQGLLYFLYPSLMILSRFLESTLYVILGNDVKSVVDQWENPCTFLTQGYKKHLTVE